MRSIEKLIRLSPCFPFTVASVAILDPQYRIAGTVIESLSLDTKNTRTQKLGILHTWRGALHLEWGSVLDYFAGIFHTFPLSHLLSGE